MRSFRTRLGAVAALVGGLLTAGVLPTPGRATAGPALAVGTVFVTDSGNSQVLQIAPGGAPQTPIGTGLSFPFGVAVDAAGDVFIADTGPNRVVKVPADGSPQTPVRTGLSSPFGVAVDAPGDVFIADTGNNRVVKVPADGSPQTLVGTGLSSPTGVAVDAAGDVVIADVGNDRVVRVPADGGPQTPVGPSRPQLAGVAVYAPPPTFTADTPPATATVGTAYSYTYTARTPVGEPGARFAIFSGTLPPGLTLDPATGRLSGTPTTPGSYRFRAKTQNHANATPGPVTTIAVSKGAQAVVFTSIRPAHAIVGGTYHATARGGASGNPVRFSLDASSTTWACTVSSAGSVRFIGPGSCVIDADQAGNPIYNPAPRTTQAISISKVAQAITFLSTPPANQTVGGTYHATARGGASGNPVRFSLDASSTTWACTVSSAGSVRFTGPGSCVIDADQAGNPIYNPAPRTTQSIRVVKAESPLAVPPGGPSGRLAATGTRVHHHVVTGTALLLLGTVTLLVAGRRRARLADVLGTKISQRA